jgi:hypothetical protein
MSPLLRPPLTDRCGLYPAEHGVTVPEPSAVHRIAAAVREIGRINTARQTGRFRRPVADPLAACD